MPFSKFDFVVIEAKVELVAWWVQASQAQAEVVLAIAGLAACNHRQSSPKGSVYSFYQSATQSLRVNLPGLSKQPAFTGNLRISLPTRVIAGNAGGSGFAEFRRGVSQPGQLIQILQQVAPLLIGFSEESIKVDTRELPTTGRSEFSRTATGLRVPPFYCPMLQRAFMKIALKTRIRTLASACFLGSSCCTAMLFSQQLQPQKEPAAEQFAPIISAAQAIKPVKAELLEEDLPPVVSAASRLKKLKSAPVPGLPTPRPALAPVATPDRMLKPLAPATLPKLTPVKQVPAAIPDMPSPIQQATKPVPRIPLPIQQAQQTPVPVNQTPLAVQPSPMPAMPIRQATTPGEPTLAPVVKAPVAEQVVEDTQAPLPVQQQPAPVVAARAIDLAAPTLAAEPAPVTPAPIKGVIKVAVAPKPEVTVQAPEQPGIVSSTAVTVPSEGTLQKGRNFPVDAQQKIAEFIRANGVRANGGQPGQVDAVGYATAPPVSPAQQEYGIRQVEPQIHRHAQPVSYPPLQDASPSDVLPPLPVPTRQTAPQAPVIGGQGIVTPPQRVPLAGPQNNAPLQATPPGSFPQQNAPHNQLTQPGSNDYFQSPQEYQEEYVDPAAHYGPIDDVFDCCGFVGDARNYLIVDALHWERTDGVFRASNMTTVDDFDYSWGGRITWGSRRDSTRGIEASYMQFDPWLAVSNQFNGAGSLVGTLFGSQGGFAPATFSAFQGSTFIEQFHKTDLHSFELNKTWWGSDVAKAFIGARYIHFDNEFHLSSANVLGQQGIYTLDATNNMFGLHIGGELLYDIGYRLSFSVHGKLGGYANFYDGRAGLLNNGTQFLFNSREDTDFAYSAEIGATARYKLSRNARLRIGYDVMALLDIRDVQSTFSTVVTPTTGTVFNEGDAGFHGASIGFEIYR